MSLVLINILLMLLGVPMVGRGAGLAVAAGLPRRPAPRPMTRTVRWAVA